MCGERNLTILRKKKRKWNGLSQVEERWGSEAIKEEKKIRRMNYKGTIGHFPCRIAEAPKYHVRDLEFGAEGFLKWGLYKWQMFVNKIV